MSTMLRSVRECLSESESRSESVSEREVPSVGA